MSLLAATILCASLLTLTNAFGNSNSTFEDSVSSWPFYSPSIGDQYFIYSAMNGKVIETGGYEEHNGAKAQMWPYKKSDYQKWQFYKTFDGYYQIRHYKSERCLDINGASKDSGARAVIWDNHGGDNQLWSLEYENGSGLLTIRSKNSRQCLHVSRSSNAYGTAVVQWSCNGGSQQKWYLFPANGC